MANGMKSGASSSPFDDTDDEEESAGDDVQEETSTQVETEIDAADDSAGDEYPLKMRRDSVKDEREMVQFFLQESTQRSESRHRSQVETILGEEVPLTDFREAAYIVGMENHHDIAEQLREWGFDL